MEKNGWFALSARTEKSVSRRMNLHAFGEPEQYAQELKQMAHRGMPAPSQQSAMAEMAEGPAALLAEEPIEE